MLFVTDASFGAAIERGASSSGRDRLWLEAFRRFLSAPILGEGPGLLARNPGVAGWAGHPHNSALLIAAETGVVGLAAAGVLVARGGAALLRLAFDRRPWALALVSGGAHSLLSGTNIMPASQAMLVLAIAMALPAASDTDAADVQQVSSAPARPWSPLALAVVGVLALAILLATLTLPGGNTVGFPGPRFFKHGIIP